MNAKAKEIQTLRNYLDTNKHIYNEQRVRAIEQVLNQIFASREGGACVNFEEFYARSDALAYMVS